MDSQPFTLHAALSRESMLAALQARRLERADLVDDAGRRVGEATAAGLAAPSAARPNPVLVMAGGLGTRLRAITGDRIPKPMVEVGGRPIIENILEQLASYGLRRAWLAVNHKAEIIRGHFGDGSRVGMSIEYIVEEKPLGTAGALALLPVPLTSPLVMMNGDLLTRLNFDSLLAAHERDGNALTICVRRHEVQVPYGVVELSGGRVRSIAEKPILSNFINAGVYVLSPAAVSRVSPDEALDVTDLIARLLETGERVGAFPLVDYWSDVGTPGEYHEALRLFSSEAP